MGWKRSIRAAIAIGLSAQIASLGVLGSSARAEIASTGAAISKYMVQADRGQLLSELERAEVRAKMIELGVDPAEAKARLSALSDDEIAEMIAQIENGEAGADSVIGILFTVFIILLVTDLLCLTKVFKFTRCAR